MHAVTANSANGEETDATIQPPPMQPLLTRLTKMALAEMIERHIDYVHPETGGSVHLSAPFVKHYHTRTTDDALPTVTAIATLPLVMTNGALLSQSGLDRQRGIVFRVHRNVPGHDPQAGGMHSYRCRGSHGVPDRRIPL